MATFRKGYSAQLIFSRKISTTTTPNKPATVTWQITAVDALSLRGIPAIGRGVAGQIPGTRPDSALDATRPNPHNP